jgi:hypothetical protein
MTILTKFYTNSIADSNYRGKWDVGGFLIFEWTLVTFPGSANLTTSPQPTSTYNVPIIEKYYFFLMVAVINKVS